jgi:hypothetical protein
MAVALHRESGDMRVASGLVKEDTVCPCTDVRAIWCTKFVY